MRNIIYHWECYYLLQLANVLVHNLCVLCVRGGVITAYLYEISVVYCVENKPVFQTVDFNEKSSVEV